jgi:hypothetical protein
VHWLISQAFEQRTVQSGTDALAAARDAEGDADFDGLPEAFVLPVGLAGGVAQDLAPAPGHHQPVRARPRETPKPLPQPGHV